MARGLQGRAGRSTQRSGWQGGGVALLVVMSGMAGAQQPTVPAPQPVPVQPAPVEAPPQEPPETAPQPAPTEPEPTQPPEAGQAPQQPEAEQRLQLAEAPQEPDRGIQQVTVTAERRAENIQNVPIAVTAFSTEQLQTRGITDIHGLTQLTPNVNLDAGAPFSGDSSVLSASIRGIGQDDFAFNLDPGVGVYLDGVYLARTIAANQNLLDVDRIEILKGPQGTLFGANTIGGAINIVTHVPGDTPRVIAQVTGGSFSRRDLAMTADLPVTSTLLTTITFSTLNRDGYQRVIPYPADTVYGQYPWIVDPQNAYPKSGWANWGDNGGQGQQVIRGKALWKATDDIRVTFTADWQHQRQSGIPNTVRAAYNSLESGNIFAFLYNYCISTPASVLNNPATSMFGPLSSTANGAVCGPRATGTGLATGGAPLGGAGYVGYGGPNGPVSLLSGQPRLYWNFAATDTGDIDTTYANGPSFANNDVFGGSVNAEWVLNENLTLKSITGYRQIRWEVGEDLDGTPETIMEVTDHQHQWQVSQEFQAIGTAFGGRLNYVGGLYYFNEAGYVHDYVPFEGLLDVYDIANDVFTKNFGVFFHADYKVTDQVGITLGGRYTEVDKRFRGGQADLNGFSYKFSGCYPPEAPALPSLGAPAGATCQQALGFPDAAEPLRYFPDGWNSQNWHIFDPTIGVQYHVTPDVMPYLSWSKGFKAGGWTTRLSNPILDARDAAFRPEYSKTWELGLKSQWFNRHLVANAALFYTDYDGIQLQIQQGASPVTQNAGNARIKGAELEMEALIGRRLSLNFAAGYIDAYYTYVNPLTGIPQGETPDGAPVQGPPLEASLPKTPKYKITIGPQYDLPLLNGATLRMVGGFTYTASMYNDALNTPLLFRPSTRNLDLSLHYISPDGIYELAAGGTNITDDRYISVGSVNLSAGVIDGTFNPPRQWYVSLIARFGH